MKQSGKLIKTRKVDFSKVGWNKEEFMRIVEDMRQNGGKLVPVSDWITLDLNRRFASERKRYFPEASSETGFDQKFSTMDKMLHPWVGDQKAPIDNQTRRQYGRLLAQYDPLDLWQANVENEVVATSLMVADLGSIIDLNLLYSFRPRGQREKTMIVEVGSGYGRLAEAAFNIFGSSIRYVCIDSVPGSLYYAKSYLEAACPNIRIGSYYHGDAFDMDNFKCYIVPSWHFSTLNTSSYDICISCQSFSEMSQEHVDYYLRMFEDVACEDATIYVFSDYEKDVFNKGEWNYPKNWRKLLRANTPRSRLMSDNHPVEIFAKSVADFSAENAAVDAFYRYSLEHFEDVDTVLLHTGARKAASPIVRYFFRRVGQAVRRRLAGVTTR